MIIKITNNDIVCVCVCVCDRCGVCLLNALETASVVVLLFSLLLGTGTTLQLSLIHALEGGGGGGGGGR